MGRAKQLWMEQQQIQEDTILAKKLGLTYEELQETDWHIESDESRDGMLYGYIVYFDDVPNHILGKIKGLNSDNQVWFSPYDLDEEEYYDYEEQYQAIIANKHYYDSFNTEVSNLKKLNEVELENSHLTGLLKRQLFVAIIGTLETFLSETFINQTEENPEYFRNFVESFPDFSSQKFQLNNIFKEYDKIKKTARKAMLEVIS